MSYENNLKGKKSPDNNNSEKEQNKKMNIELTNTVKGFL